jgi:hypothetical protein
LGGRLTLRRRAGVAVCTSTRICSAESSVTG